MLNSDSPMLQPAAAPTPDDSSDIAICDWDDLLRAVKDRLAKIVAEPPLAASVTELQRTASQVRADVLECVAALDQLQRSLSHDTARQLRDQRTGHHLQVVAPQSGSTRSEAA